MDRQALQERFGLFGEAPALRHVLERVRQVAPTDIAVLLEGESGVGKELVATAIHGLSRRRHRRLVVVNCGAIPEGLIESELFGAERGAYTGAVERRTGYFEEADGGTVFLDEIGEMPLPAQVRLLRVLETGQFSRVGSSQTQRADVRVIAATNKDLAEEVRAGRFREDLYYRLSTVLLRIPPLRQRRNDVLPLFEQFARRFAEQYDARAPRLTASARDLLQRYAWPGNVRELKNVAEQAVVLHSGQELDAAALAPLLRGVSAGAGLALTHREAPGGPGQRERELIYRALLELRLDLREVKALLHHLAGGGERAPYSAPPEFPARTDLPVPYRDARPDFPVPTFSDESFADALAHDLDDPDAFTYVVTDEEPAEVEEADVDEAGVEEPPAEEDAAVALGEPSGDGEAPRDARDALGALFASGAPLPTMEEAERALLREALRRFEGNRRQTADALGISERTLYRKLKELGDA
ncbi:MAG TPA: sigma-54 dependent transcriptional regulator [Rubricoccaceae bacterium]|nr:sigma-54 dependent transcriptional regulator [Rubricoccaceae bacterium]